MEISKHLDKDNLHHAYLIEGNREEVVPEILKFLKVLKIETNNNSDFINIHVDAFKMEDARNFRALGSERAIGGERKAYILSSNNFLLEAQNTLLKMFEDPIPNSIFFVITPDMNSLLKTLVSRFYCISCKTENIGAKGAEKFLKMSLRERVDFIKELLEEEEEVDEEGNEILLADSARSKAVNFLNSLEEVLNEKVFKSKKKPEFDHSFFKQIFKVRSFLRTPGSSAKTLMESVALTVPNI
jgi:DNA polymerase III delta prime subunit